MGRHRRGLLAGLSGGLLLLTVLVAPVGAQTSDEPVRPGDPSTVTARTPRGDAPEVAPPAPQLRLEAVRVEPSGGDAELLVRRNLPLHVGQTIDSEALVQAREHLLSTGLFAEVDLYTMRGEQPGAVTAVVSARPSRAFHLETGLGHDPLRGWYLNVLSLRRTGMFNRGGTARVSYRTGLRASGFYGELEVPEVGPRDTDLLVNLGSYDETWDINQGDSTHYQRIGRNEIEAGLRHRLTDDWSALFWSGYSHARPDPVLETVDDEPGIPASSLVPVIDDLRYGEFRGELIRNRQDPLRPWQRGSWAGLILQGSVPDHGSFFWGSECNAHLAMPVARTQAAAFRFNAIYSAADTPYFLRPVVGGVGSLRGFPTGSLSGPGGARGVCQVSAEWRHPLAGSDPRRPRVIGTLFTDCGEYWSAGGHPDFAADVGYGALLRVRWLETLNLEIGYPLTDQAKGNPVSIRLSLGRSF
jgi:outer membrane protein assembly factor BamA